MKRRHHAVSLLDAAAETPALARLLELARESQLRLDMIVGMLPADLRTAVRPGPIDGCDWCLLADDGAAAAKLRQMAPALRARLQAENCDVRSIRVKVRKRV